MSKPFNPNNLRNRFPGINTITHNYSQSDQDIFVLSVLDGKRNGTYLEIGGAWPEEINNTCLLEQSFGWRGVSIESVQEYQKDWLQKRTNPLINADATEIEFKTFCDHHRLGPSIDYLSLDCDPPNVTFKILQQIPFELLQFAVITFEHDCYSYGPDIKIASRELLSKYGYQLLVSNVSHLGVATDYEDWWVYPNLIQSNLIQLHKQSDDSIKDYEEYLYRRLSPYNPGYKKLDSAV